MALSRGKIKTLLVVVLCCLFVIPVILLILLVMGITIGEEFSPDDFSRRTFFYNRVPLLNLTVYGKSYEDTTPGFEQIMLADGLITANNNKPQVWHLCSDPGSANNGIISHECDARFLVEYLDFQDGEGNAYWEKWNEKYPKTAAIFWPVVVQYARDEMYLSVPELMRLGMEVTNDEPTSFDRQLKRLAAKAYLDVGASNQKQGEVQRAADRVSRSVEFLPSKEAYQLLQDIYQALNEPAKVEESRLAAESAEEVF